MAIALDQARPAPQLARPPRSNCRSLPHLDFKMIDLNQPEPPQSIQYAFKSTHITRSLSTPCLSYSSLAEDKSSTAGSRFEVISGTSSPRIRALILEVAMANATGASLERALGGLSGAYFLRARDGQIVAVVKPIDEEPLPFQSRKGMRSSIGSGETGPCELAAYLLDHGGFSGVPPTALVRFGPNVWGLGPDYKIASLQHFVDHESDAGDLGPSGFLVPSVHRIGILDVRLMNLDRHAGNILVGPSRRELVPIDHGFCLPESLDDPYFEWLHWPQASMPFGDAEAEYISSLDPYKDGELLRSEIRLIRESSIRVLIVCTVFLKQAAGYGLCLADIGEMMTGEFFKGGETWSSLEKLCMSAKARLREGPRFSSTDMLDDDSSFFQNHYQTDGHDGKGVSFGDMKDKEWEMFLEIFVGILPKAFEQRKKEKKSPTCV